MQKYRITIYVFRKTVCSNPEEPTTLKALHRLNFRFIRDIRMGKCFILSVEAADEKRACEIAENAAKKLLANSVAEEWDCRRILFRA